jgi:hypothetical protein
VCHKPSALLRGLGITHVDLFVLDCEGCELRVVQDLATSGRVEVDVWVVEANAPFEVSAALAATHALAACLGPAPDLVFVRRGSAPAQQLARADKRPLAERCPFDLTWTRLDGGQQRTDVPPPDARRKSHNLVSSAAGDLMQAQEFLNSLGETSRIARSAVPLR